MTFLFLQASLNLMPDVSGEEGECEVLVASFEAQNRFILANFSRAIDIPGESCGNPAQIGPAQNRSNHRADYRARKEQ